MVSLSFFHRESKLKQHAIGCNTAFIVNAFTIQQGINQYFSVILHHGGTTANNRLASAYDERSGEKGVG